MRKRSNTLIRLQFSEKSTADLRGRQSVRTTFKLSERSIDALGILARQLGIKQKSLFDHLIDDRQALTLIAKEFDELNSPRHRVAKTYVISRRTLEILEQISMQFDTPRDALVEYSIERILPLIEKEKEKHGKRKELRQDLQKYFETGAKLLERAEQELGQDDPVFQAILSMMRGVSNSSTKVDACVEKGKILEEF